MAKNNEAQMNYQAEVRLLKDRGPLNLYLLWGQEDYLREHFFQQIKEMCIPPEEDSFSYKRLDGPELDVNELREAVDAMPFMTERTLVELRGVDINKLQDAENYISVLSDIPEYCTVIFVQSADYELDGRMKLVKMLKSKGKELKFTPQPQNYLFDWIKRRFAAAGKNIDRQCIERLILISGERMNALIPEIDKIAAYAQGSDIKYEDVEAVANHIPEAVIFSITELIAQKEYDKASVILAELLSTRKSEPIAMLAMIGLQMRRLYAARLAIDMGLGAKYLMDNCAIKFDFIAKKLMASAKGFSLKQLSKAVELCAEADYTMKSCSADDTALIRELFMRIASGEADA